MINLYNLRLSFFLIVIPFLYGCQLDQSVNLIKEKLFSDSNATANLEKEKVSKEKKRELVSEEKKINYKNIKKKTQEVKEAEFTEKDEISNIAPEEKSDSKTKIKETNALSFKEMGKARDNDSKIVSFFSKIFDTDDSEELIDLKSEKNEDSNFQKKEKLSKRKLSDDLEKIINLQKPIPDQDQTVSKDKLQVLDEIDTNISDEEKKKINKEEISDNYQSKEKQFNEESLTNKDSNKDEGDLAFFQLKPPIVKKKLKEKDKLVGLLLPLTGAKSSAGKIVINSLRYSMLLKPNQLNFKIFDTKGSPEGAIIAAREGIRTGVNTFIGPIFSDETKEVRNYFSNKDDLTFFSLSPDLSNVSENVIVSGQNPEDQISCIVQHITGSDPKKILLIYHADRYGFVIKQSVQKSLENFGLAKLISTEYFEIERSTVLNDEIKQLSQFELRKNQLKKEIENLKQNKTLDQKLKNKQLKSLERKLTLDSPFDHIIVASEGERLLEILSHLAFYDINAENTNIYGTSLWEDTNKKDNVFKNAYFVTSLRERNQEFNDSFRSVFSKAPMSFNYHIHDLLSFVQNFKLSGDEEKAKEIFYGEFSTSKINSGLLKRGIFLKKIIKDNSTKEVFSCKLDAL